MTQQLNSILENLRIIAGENASGDRRSTGDRKVA
jgi:hypothetical protein